MRGWRNWQTRTFEGRVGNRTGSSPVLRTISSVHNGFEVMDARFFLSDFYVRSRIKSCSFLLCRLCRNTVWTVFRSSSLSGIGFCLCGKQLGKFLLVSVLELRYVTKLINTICAAASARIQRLAL